MHLFQFSQSLVPHDELSLVFVTLFSVVGAAALVFFYLNTRRRLGLIVAAAYIGSALGAVTAGNLFGFVVFWELAALSSYLLVIYRRDEIQLASGYRYLLAQIIAGASLFLAASVQYGLTGSLALGEPVPAAAALFMLAFGIKAAAMPFHVWLPDTYPELPVHTTVVLSGFTTKLGLYGMFRFFGGTQAIALWGLATAAFGAIMALRTNHLRRLLCYLLIAGSGHVMVGIGTGHTDAAAALLINEVLYIMLLFMTAGIAVRSAGGEDLPRLQGIGRRMPWLSSLWVVGALALVGAPPVGSFPAKAVLKEAVSPLGWGLVVVGLLMAVSVIRCSWRLFAPGSGSDGPLRPVSPGRYLPATLLAALSVTAGLAYRAIPLSALHGLPPLAEVYSPVKVLEAVLPLLLAGALFALLRSAVAAVGTSSRPADVDRLYARLLHGHTYLSRQLADKTSGHTQEHLMVITAGLIVLIFLLI